VWVVPLTAERKGYPFPFKKEKTPVEKEEKKLARREDGKDELEKDSSTHAREKRTAKEDKYRR